MFTHILYSIYRFGLLNSNPLLLYHLCKRLKSKYLWLVTWPFFVGLLLGGKFPINYTSWPSLLNHHPSISLPENVIEYCMSAVEWCDMPYWASRKHRLHFSWTTSQQWGIWLSHSVFSICQMSLIGQLKFDSPREWLNCTLGWLAFGLVLGLP